MKVIINSIKVKSVPNKNKDPNARHNGNKIEASLIFFASESSIRTESVGFSICHKSKFCKGRLNPFHNNELNQPNVIRDGNDAIFSEDGFTYQCEKT